MKRIALVVLGVLVVTLGAAAWKRHEIFRRAAGLREFTGDDFTESVQLVPMRDGVKLHTEIYLPAGVKSAPTVLVRNPYEYLRLIERLQCQSMARYGYACVLQDVRGQMDSEGDWTPIVHEREDGLDTLQWLVAQPFVDGNVAMRGPSYLTCTQWAVADALPPQVKTLIPSVFGTDLRLAVYERGLFRHDILTAWATLMPSRGMRHFAGNDYLRAAAHRPPLEADEKFIGQRVEWYRNALSSSDPTSQYWETDAMRTFRSTPERVKVPMLFVGAFFDPFFMAQRDTWNRVATQSDSVFVIGPWNHLGLTSGDANFSKAPGRLDQWPIMLEWLDHTLRGAPLTTLHPGTVQTFAVGGEGWVSHSQWPEPSVPTTTLHLGDGANAQSCDGGTLLPSPGPTEETSYTYAPENPVPTQGGASLLSFAFFRTLRITPGPVDQGTTCEREDVLTFRGPPVAESQVLSGAATLHLTVRSTAPDTAFVARLIAEQDGHALLVRENAATFAWPTAETTVPQMPARGSPVQLTINFWPIEWVLPVGGRWRVDVMSSSFPALHSHSNRAGPWELQDGSDVAQQTLELGGGKSTLELPLHAP